MLGIKGDLAPKTKTKTKKRTNIFLPLNLTIKAIRRWRMHMAASGHMVPFWFFSGQFACQCRSPLSER